MFRSTEKTKKAIFAKCGIEVHEIAGKIKSSIRNGQTLRLKTRSTIWGAITRIGLLTIFNANTKWATDTCSSCGLCEKFCITRSIVIENGRPRFLSRCAQCFGCAHWCPNRAIRYGQCTINDVTHYTHPDITASELMHYND